MPSGGILSLLTRTRIRNVTLAVLVAILITMLWQSDQSERSTDDLLTDSEQGPDGFVENGRYLSFNEQGQLAVEVTSPRIEQYEGRQEAIMESPRATLVDASPAEPWHLTANHGQLRQDRQELVLSGNVVVTRTAADGREAILTTSRLTLDNARRTVFTDQPVTMTEPGGVTSAIGMKAWIDDRILELQSNVEGTYEPAKY